MARSARESLEALLWELPAEFSMGPPEGEGRQSFQVIKQTNVRKVHQALWELQRYFDINQEGSQCTFESG